MKGLDELKSYSTEIQTAYRLVNSKFPPIALFDDVASEEEFELLYQVQALTNPRLLAEAGRPSLLPRDEIPFGISGCSYAVAPFTHLNPDGSRFSDGSYGVLYLADAVQTAIAEVRYHQQQYWEKVSGLKFDRFVFRCFRVEFSVPKKPEKFSGFSALRLPSSHPVYDVKSYKDSRVLGAKIKELCPGATLHYQSVRRKSSVCWALFSPRYVASVKQNQHYEMVWNEQLVSVSRLSQVSAT